MPASLTLFVPGLLRPFSERHQPGLPALPALERLLARADSVPAIAAGKDAALARLFDRPGQDPLPAAALSWLGDTGHPADGHLLRADPVHLHPDRDRLLLFDGGQLAISPAESGQLTAALSDYFSEQGMTLSAPRPERGYLHLPTPVAMQTRAPVEISGRDVLRYMPDGDDGPGWRTRLNEVQMLLHQHPVNQQREERGQATINSLWFWGNGAPLEPRSSRYTAVYSDDPVTAGLARLAANPCNGVPDDATQWQKTGGLQGRQLLQLDAIDRALTTAAPEAWSDALQSLERDWLQPLSDAIAVRALAGLTLADDSGREYRLTRSGLRRWWRRTPAYTSYLHPGDRQ